VARDPRSEARRRRLLAVRRLLARVDVRVVLSVCIIVSLLPFPWVHRFDLIFLALFSLEFVARLLLVFREGWFEDGSTAMDQDDGWRWPSASRTVFLLLDFAALISFLPWEMFGCSSATGRRWCGTWARC
jgi:hypothetical protein